MTLSRAAELLLHPGRCADQRDRHSAVRGLGGSWSIHRDKTPSAHWEIDFDSRHKPMAGRSGLSPSTTCHSRCNTTRDAYWLLFYTSLLNVRKTPVQDVLDPAGSAQPPSSNHGRAFRLVLMPRRAAQTLSSRSSPTCFGSGVQHIAFVTSDIFATASGCGKGVECWQSGKLLR